MTVYTPGAVHTVTGSIDNAGTIVIEGGVAATPAGAVVTYTGRLDNATLIQVTGGDVVTATGGTLALSGTLDNAGSIDVGIGSIGGGAAQLTIALGGLVADDGTITVEGSLANAGSLLVDGGPLSVTGALVNDGSVGVAAGSSIDHRFPPYPGGVLTDSGTLTNNSVIELDGGLGLGDVGPGGGPGGWLVDTGLIINAGILLIDGGQGLVGYPGGLEGGAGAIMTITATGSLNNSASLIIGSGGSGFEFDDPGGDGGTLGDGGLLTNNGSITVEGGTAADVSRSNGDGGTLAVSGSLVNSTIIVVQGGSAASAGSGGPGGVLIVNGTLDNAGSINIAGPGTGAQPGGAALLTVTAGGTVFDHGSLSVEGLLTVTGGRLVIAADAGFTDPGDVTVQGGGELDLFASSTVDIAFGDPGLLVIGPQAAYNGTLSGLAPGDQIQIDGRPIANAGIFGTTLFVGFSSGVTGTYRLAPGQTVYDLGPSQGSDGLQDLLTVECFAAGTHIRTLRGDVAVEHLRLGEAVMTQDGDCPPIIWIGRREILCAAHPAPERVWPVRITAGAFGPGLPTRDLWLSPDHAVFADGVLVPIRYLINGTTIARQPVERVAYWHVELPRHALLLAEGLAAESYLETGHRAAFADTATPPRRDRDYAARAREASGCAPITVTGPAVAALRDRLRASAALAPA